MSYDWPTENRRRHTGRNGQIKRRVVWIIPTEQVGIILDGIVGSSDPEVLVDQVSNLSSAKGTVLFLWFFVPPD